MTVDRLKLAKALGMLGSAHDGEILAAARQAERMRRDAGLTWSAILGAGGTSSPIAELIEQLIEDIERLNPWGRQFVRSVDDRDPEQLTPRQIAVVERLARGLRASRRAA